MVIVLNAWIFLRVAALGSATIPDGLFAGSACPSGCAGVLKKFLIIVKWVGKELRVMQGLRVMSNLTFE